MSEEKRQRRLFLYGTVYNNANRIDACLDSLRRFRADGIFIVDNFSTDGTYEKMQKREDLKVIRLRCTRGKGRQAALDEALKLAGPDDLILNIDLDVVYKEPYIECLEEYKERVKDDEFYSLGFLSTPYTNKKVPWMNLNASDDVERNARALTKGVKIYEVHPPEDMEKYLENEKVAGIREGRYASGYLGLQRRFFKALIDAERGSDKSFDEFYSNSPGKTFMHWLIYRTTYTIAKMEGVYSYNSDLNNYDYVEKNLIRLYERKDAGKIS